VGREVSGHRFMSKSWNQCAGIQGHPTRDHQQPLEITRQPSESSTADSRNISIVGLWTVAGFTGDATKNASNGDIELTSG
jgi:hypothetical protein